MENARSQLFKQFLVFLKTSLNFKKEFYKLKGDTLGKESEGMPGLETLSSNTLPASSKTHFRQNTKKEYETKYKKEE